MKIQKKNGKWNENTVENRKNANVVKVVEVMSC